MTEYRTDKAIVRIRPGKLTDEERKVVLEAAVKDFYKAILKQSQNTKKEYKNEPKHDENR